MISNNDLSLVNITLDMAVNAENVPKASLYISKTSIWASVRECRVRLIWTEIDGLYHAQLAWPCMWSLPGDQSFLSILFFR